MNKESQWRSLSGPVEWIFVHKNWRSSFGFNRSHRWSCTRCFAPFFFWRSHYQPCYISKKIVAFGAQKTRKHTLKGRHCFSRILAQRYNWAIFFENEQGEVITVNGDRYRVMWNEFLFTKIEEKDIGNIWFQKDGATCHTAEAILDVLRSAFKDRCSADVVWPPRSCEGCQSKISATPKSQRQLTL